MLINLSEGHVNSELGAATIDALVATFLRDVVRVAQEGGREVVVAVLSDHGRAYGRYFAISHGGRLENKLPIMQMVIPRSVVPGGASGVAALVENQRRLTSHFDLHRTVLQLAGLDVVDWHRHGSPGARGGGGAGKGGDDALFSAARNGRSFFVPVPVTRSCRDAGIPADWCPCDGTWKPFTYTNDAAFLAVQVLAEVNRDLILGALPAGHEALRAADPIVEWITQQRQGSSDKAHAEFPSAHPFACQQLVLRRVRRVIVQALDEHTKNINYDLDRFVRSDFRLFFCVCFFWFLRFFFLPNKRV
jgi:hypothetical protein